MHDYTKDIRQAARRLLAEGKVDVVIGFRRSRLALRNAPLFARNESEAEKLVWDAGCGLNLAKYLPGRFDRIAVVAKGCDIRVIVAMVKERQIERNRVVIIGVPCEGMVSRRKVEAILDGEELVEVSREGSTLILSTKEGDRRVDVSDLLLDSCVTCNNHEPSLFDVRIGVTEPSGRAIETFADIRNFEALSSIERYEWFREEFSRCIRCYACRNVCPVCGCEQCFVDNSAPAWIGKGDDVTNTLLFHIVRAFHSAGRCVDCGACERACPMGINLRCLTAKVRKDVQELFGADAGADAESTPALATFKPDDPEDEIWRNPSGK